MAHDDHRAVVLVERRGDNRQMAEVDVVGRLVQYQKPRFEQHQAREGDKALLSLRERAYFRVYQFAGYEERRRGGCAGSPLLPSPSRRRARHARSCQSRGSKSPAGSSPRARPGLSRAPFAVPDAIDSRSVALPYPVGAAQKEVLILAQCDLRFVLDRLVVLYRQERGDVQDIADQLRL